MRISERLRAAESPYEVERVEPEPNKPAAPLDAIQDSVFAPLKAIGWKLHRISNIAEPEIRMNAGGYQAADPGLIIRWNPKKSKMAVYAHWPAEWGALGVPGAKERKPGGRIKWGEYVVWHEFPIKDPKAGAAKVVGLLKKVIPPLAKGAKGKKVAMKISEMIKAEGVPRSADRASGNKVGDDVWEAMMKDKALFGILDSPEKAINWKRVEQALTKSMKANIPNIPASQRKSIADSYVKWMKGRVESRLMSIYKDLKDLVQTQIPERVGNK